MFWFFFNVLEDEMKASRVNFHKRREVKRWVGKINRHVWRSHTARHDKTSSCGPAWERGSESVWCAHLWRIPLTPQTPRSLDPLHCCLSAWRLLIKRDREWIFMPPDADDIECFPSVCLVTSQPPPSLLSFQRQRITIQQQKKKPGHWGLLFAPPPHDWWLPLLPNGVSLCDSIIWSNQ